MQAAANDQLTNPDSFDSRQLRTVGIFLCPYRNLTTLTAATLALHRNIQVMNHGGRRLLEGGALEFLINPNARTYERFCTSLIALSKGGKRGNYGGSITFSHAFDHHQLKEAYERRFSNNLIKPDIQSIVWKEGGIVQAMFWKSRIDPVSLSVRFPQLRFVSPIRNPLDHAFGLQKYYKDGIQEPVQNYLCSTRTTDLFRYILTAHKSFFDLHARAPERFLYFFEEELGPNLAQRLTRFFQADDDPEWNNLFPKVMVNVNPYAHKNEKIFKSILYSEYGGDKPFIGHMERTLVR